MTGTSAPAVCPDGFVPLATPDHGVADATRGGAEEPGSQESLSKKDSRSKNEAQSKSPLVSGRSAAILAGGSEVLSGTDLPNFERVALHALR